MTSVRLFRFLLQNARGTVAVMTAAGVLAGLFSAGVLAVVSRAVSAGAHPAAKVVVAFIALAIGKIVANATAQLYLVKFSQTTILELSLALCSKILNAPLRVIERRGGAAVLVTLTDDVSSVTWAVQTLPQLAMNGAIVVGCSLYLAWLSWQMFLAAMVVGLLGAGVYKILHTRAFKRIHAARDARERLLEHFRSLTLGIKELMMHRARRDALLSNEIRPAAHDYRTHNMAATTHYAIAEGWVQTLYHAIIALVLFVFPLFARQSTEVLTGYIFAMLYMMTPLWSIIGALPIVSRGQVALQQIDDLGVSLDSARVSSEMPVTIETQTPAIDMSDVVFTYEPSLDAEHGFSLGPINFQLAPGELVFVVGGNGSGKSTFVKVLMGLYAPHEGELRMGDVLVGDSTREWYREHFSAVFPDCYIFSKLHGLTAPDLEVAARQYLEQLQIAHRVSVRTTADGAQFSTVELSTGQKKRLALVTAYLEDRPFYVFDEWAADQDPEYKQIFYAKLLPDLRARGKAVVVITHDDRYFHMGDRVIKLEDGKMVEWNPTESRLLADVL